MAWWPGALDGPSRYLLFGGAFASYAIAGACIKDARGGAVLIWGVAVALRLALLFAEPVLSHEVFRYLWDGQVQMGRINPFRFPPIDPELAGLRTVWFSQIPDAASLTPYPPLSQLSFAALSLVGGTVLQAKLLWLGFDLGTGWLLGRIALFTGRSRRLTQLLYLWSPLLVVEVAWSGHLVPLVLFLLALVVLLSRARFSAGVAAGLATAAAPVALAAFPALALRLRGRFVAGWLAAAGVAVLPYLTAPASLARALWEPYASGRFLEGPFLLLASALTNQGARVALALVVLAVGIWAAVKRYRPERALLWVLGAAILLAPIFHAEHALWILPFAALRVSRPWLLFTGLAFLAYTGAPVGAEPPPEPSVWIQVGLWLPLVAALGWEARQMMKERFPLPPVEF